MSIADTDYRKYADLREAGATADDAYVAAAQDGRDWTYCMRMLREGYDLSLADARDVLLRNSDPKAPIQHPGL